MRNFKTLVQQSLLALALFASGAAFAGPSYNVSVNTSAYSGQGVLDFNFLANGGATAATATLSNFGGAFGAEVDRSAGVAGAIPGQLVLDNQDGGDTLAQFVTLGGLFTFTVRFDGDFASVDNADGTTFSVSLYNADFSAYIGPEGSLAAFELIPALDGVPGGVVAAPPSPLASVAQVADVPEPSDLLLVLSALALLGFARRRAAR